VQASDEVITKSRVGGYPREHLFPLRQSWQAYRYYQSLITTCDQEMAEQLQNLDSPMPPDASPWPPERYRIYGTDLTAIPSLNALTGYTVLAEVGTDWSKFRNGMLLLPGRASVPKTKRAEVRFSRPTPAGVPTG
jgi:hypothetical protein